MKKYLIRVIIFFCPIVFLLSFELFLPLNFFTYRPWEALIYEKNGMKFVPNQKLPMISVGDLCAYTNYAIKKNELWITDNLGFRNNSFISNPDVLVIGDSFIVGCSLHQDSILTNTLNKKTKGSLTFYNIASATFSDFIQLLNLQIIQKPKIVIFSIVECDDPPAIRYLSYNYKTSYFSIIKYKLTRSYCQKYLSSMISRKSIPFFPQSPINEKMFFLDIKQEEHNVVENANIIKTYKNFCDSLSIDFIFLPMPNKKTVYFEEVPFSEQPNYLLELAKELDKLGIMNINTLEIYNNFRANNEKRIYHYDDIHWNWDAVNIISDTILSRIGERKRLE